MKRLGKNGTRSLWSHSAVIGLVAIAVGLAVFFWNFWRIQPVYGVLVKAQDQYIVAWREPGGELQSRVEVSLKEALTFARMSLRLDQGLSEEPSFELEHLWVEDRFGTYVLLWKTVRSPYLNQVTFNRQEDAYFFAEAFTKGSYTTSPFGHAVLLTPIHSKF